VEGQSHGQDSSTNPSRSTCYGSLLSEATSNSTDWRKYGLAHSVAVNLVSSDHQMAYPIDHRFASVPVLLLL
jgi:hypothetical protein